MNMRIFHARTRAGIAVLTLLSFVTSPVAPLLLAQTPSTKATAGPAAATAPAPAVEGWPRAFSTASGAALVIYQPQVASWVDQKHAVLYSAVSYTPKGATQPALGTLKVESDTSVAVDERLVSFSQFNITEPNFPTLKRGEVGTVVKEITASVPLNERVIALDRVLANMDTSQIIPRNVEGVKADPPPIFFSKTPAVLVNIDGDPIWAPIAQNDLKSAVNTNWDLFEHGPTKTYYLRNDTVWMKATDVKGPWTPAGTLPESFKKLPADDNWKDVTASLPGTSVSASQAAKVFVSLTPAELILLRGEPNYLAVPGAKELLWVSNTESDVFRMGLKGPVLLSRLRTLVLRAGFRRAMDVRHANAPGGLQADPTRAPAFARPGLGAGHDTGSGGHPARSDSADGDCQQDGAGAGSRVSGRRAAVPADREDERAARGQYRQGHPEGRRPLLHVLSGRLVHVDHANGPVGGNR